MKKKLLTAILILWSLTVSAAYLLKFGFSLEAFRFFPGESAASHVNFTDLALVILNSLISTALLLFVLASAYFTGRKLLDRLGFRSRNPENTVISFSLGFCLLSFSMLLIGGLSLLYKIPVLLGFAALSFYSLLYIKKEKFERDRKKFTLTERALFVTGGLFIFMNFICCLAPETYYDSLLYHLAVPSLYILNHGIVNIPYNLFSNFPQNLDMLYMLGLLLKGGELAKLINLSLGVLCLAAVYVYAKKYFDRVTALFAAVLFYSVPMTSVNQVNTQLDVSMALFAVLGFIMMLEWINSKQKRAVYLALSGLFLGFAIGAKYSAAIFFIPVLIMYLYSLNKNRTSAGTALKYTAILTACSLIFVLPWLVKNIIFNGNVFYPYFSDLPGLRTLLTEQRGAVFGSFLSLVFFPWTTTMGEVNGNWHLGPVLLMLLPVVLYTMLGLKRRDPALKNMVSFFIISFLLWIVFTRITRFFMPGIIIYCIIAAYGISRFTDGWKKTVCLALIIFAVHNFLWVSALHLKNADPLAYIFGKVSRSEYLSTERPSYPNPAYPAIDFINKDLKGPGKVLFAGETRGFYCNKIFITHSVFDKIPVNEIFDAYGTTLPLAVQRLKGLDVKYILINVKELNRLRSVSDIYKERNPVYAEFFTKACRLLYNENNLYVYEVL